MSIEHQAYLIHSMAGKNIYMAGPSHVNVPKNIKNSNNVSSIDYNLNASPAQAPKGTVDGSNPVEGTDLGINL